MEKSKVSIIKGRKNPNGKEIDSMVRKAVGLVRGLNQISRGDVILIKPNVVVPINHSEGATTNPLICKTIVERQKQHR